MKDVSLSDDGRTLVVRLPMRLARYGSRKQVVVPQGEATWAPSTPAIDSTLVKAIARAFRWRRMIESGAYATVEEIATAEKINPSYVSRVLRLCLIAPDLVETILEGRQAPQLSLPRLLKPFPTAWADQPSYFGDCGQHLGPQRRFDESPR